MALYCRNRVPGGTYFFTVVLRDRRADLLTREIDALRAAIRAVRRARPFHIDAWVVLPDHMHCVWTLPAGDADYKQRWRLIKMAFNRAISRDDPRTAVMRRRGERGVWQRRYWEHTIRDDRDYAAHLDYVHFNPVRHGYVDRAADWPYSTFRACVARGLYPSSWAAGPHPEPEVRGERR